MSLGDITSTKESSPQLFVGGLSSATTSSDLFNYFQQFGLILYCEVQRSDSGKSKRFGFVKYADPVHARFVFESNDHYVGNKKVTIEWASDPIAKQISQETRIFRKVYVGNIPSWTNKQEIEDLISTFGKIEKITRLRRKDDGSMYCYAIMQDISSAQTLLRLQHIKSSGNLQLVIKPFTPQKSKVDANLQRIPHAQQRGGALRYPLPEQAELHSRPLIGGKERIWSSVPHDEEFRSVATSKADKFPVSQKSQNHIARDESQKYHLKMTKIVIRAGLELELRKFSFLDKLNSSQSWKPTSDMDTRPQSISPDCSASDQLFRFNISATKRVTNGVTSMV